MVKRSIGIDVPVPEQTCNDVYCPFHSNLSLRGALLEGRVISSKTVKTVVVEREYLHYIPKYERYERRRSKIAAHNPPCIAAKEGDWVRIAECRPISKTKHFVVIQKLSKP